MEEILASIRRIISDEVAAEPQMPRSENPRAEAARPAGPSADIAATITGAAGRNAPARIASGSPAGTLPNAAASEVSTDAAEADVPASGDSVRRAPSAARPAGAPRSPAVYSSYAPAGRPPAADPFSAHRRQASAAALGALSALPVERAPVAEPQPILEAARTEPALPQPAAIADDADLDASLSAALFDLSLVEQAVQAELATMTVDAALHVATADDERSSAELPQAGHAEPEVAVSDDHPADAFAAAPLQVPSAPETDDMQVQARPAHAPSRAAGSEPAEERRAPETRVPEAARPSEPRFLPAAARASSATETPAVAPVPPEAPSRLVSTATNAAVSTAFGTLARTVASNSRTVDDLVTEALRPMLKAWLDENLPTLVERLVRAEIERVARQGL